MDFATTIVTPIVNSLLVPVKRHLGFLFSSSTYVRDMHAKMTLLDDKASDMRTRQIENNAKCLVVPHHVPKWLEQVEKLKVEMTEKIPVVGVGCFKMKMRYKAGKRSYIILRDIDHLMYEESKIEWTNEQIPLGKVSSKRTSTSAPVLDDDDGDGTQKRSKSSRDLIFNDALKLLESNDNKARMMALCGMGGVGKTTMMEQLKKAAEDRKMFDWIVKVVVGKDLNPILIQKTIADYMSQSLTEETIDARAERLRKRFEGMSEEGKKKILVILDDVWGELNLKDIGLTIPLPIGFNLLLTSRDETVCSRMGIEASSVFRIEILKEQEAKTLFWETVGLVPHGDIESIGEDIIKRCGGLPIAITTIACALRNKEKYAWEDTVYRLQNKEFRILDNIFEISYKNLKEDDKATFLLSGLFPEDYNINIEDLLRYGWGLKQYKNVHTIAKARSRVKTCVDNLICSNLLIKSDYEGFVKMHDLVRDFTLCKFSEVKQALIANHDDSHNYEQLKKDEYYERILFKCGGMFEFIVDFNHPNLKLLMLMGENKQFNFLKDFYTRMEKLEVAAYINLPCPFLPRYSTNLRALSLRSCPLMDVDISFLGDLVSLEVLVLADCGIKRLPSKLCKLKRLKLLDLTGCVDLCIEDGVFQNLEKLEELYMRVSKGPAIRLTDANWDELLMLSKKLSTLEVEFSENCAQLTYMSFEKLERFRISIGCLLRDIYSLENTLLLASSSKELFECKIYELFGRTEILYLQVNDMSNLEDILTNPPQNSFCNLKILHISNCVELTYLFTIPVAKGLMNLESLIIWWCGVLKAVIHGENRGAGVIKFDKLKFLSLKDLPELVCLCDPVNVVEFPQLLDLDLENLQHVTGIFPGSNINISAEQPLFNVAAPMLKKLHISRMNHLKEIWPCKEEVNNISMLREINVGHCNSLVNIFPSNPMRLLGHLERLIVQNCGFIEVLFNIDLGKNEQLSSNDTLSKIEVMNCERLREAWRIKNAKTNDSGNLVHGFQAVESICIQHCERFRNLITPTTAKFKMRALKDIRIFGCGEYGELKNESVKTTKDQEIIILPKEDISKVGALVSIVALPSYEITTNFHNLHKIQCRSFQGMEVVFEINGPSNYEDQAVTTQPRPLKLLPYLEHLELDSMDNMTHVWKCSNWNEIFVLRIHQPQSSVFQNLTTIYLKSCKKINYLFSSLMVKLLSNLKKVDISFCDDMNEVVLDINEEMTTSTSAHTYTILFPLLDILELSGLHNLKHIGGGQSKVSQLDVVSWSLCQYSREILITGCDALSSVIPSYVSGQMQNLQVLSIKGCKSMEEVFETKDINTNSIVGCPSSSKVSAETTVANRIPRNIIMHKLPNLKILNIDGCERLEYIFTFSTLESLKKLEKLIITKCNALKVIVREEYGEQTSTSSKNVVVPHIKSIELDRLLNLTGFFLGINIDFKWPLLDYVTIKDCPKIMAFTSGQSTTPRLKYIHSELGKHNLESGLNFHVTPMLHQKPSPCVDVPRSNPTILDGRNWSFHNLTQCNLNAMYMRRYIFPCNVLQQLQKLETIHAHACWHVKEVFQVALEDTKNESQTVVKFPKLREVDLNLLRKLKYMEEQSVENIGVSKPNKTLS